MDDQRDYAEEAANRRELEQDDCEENPTRAEAYRACAEAYRAYDEARRACVEADYGVSND